MPDLFRARAVDGARAVRPHPVSGVRGGAHRRPARVGDRCRAAVSGNACLGGRALSLTPLKHVDRRPPALEATAGALPDDAAQNRHLRRAVLRHAKAQARRTRNHAGVRLKRVAQRARTEQLAGAALSITWSRGTIARRSERRARRFTAWTPTCKCRRGHIRLRATLKPPEDA